MTDAQRQIIQRLDQILAATGGGPGGAAWGDITGTLSAQTDLQNALDLKQTAAQVQALIDAKIGSAGNLDTGGGGTVTPEYSLGVLTGATYSSPSLGFVVVTFASNIGTTNYSASAIGRDTPYLFNIANKTADDFRIYATDILGAPASGAFDLILTKQ